MSTFLYAPGIKVYINVEPRPGKKETIDVSEDLVSGNLVMGIAIGLALGIALSFEVRG